MKNKHYVFKILSFVTIITLTMVFFVNCSRNNPGVEGTTYTGSAKGYGGKVTVHVTIGDDKKINAIKVDTKKETPEVGGEAAKIVAEEILTNQSLNVDTISGATITSNAVINATENAIKDAGISLNTYRK